MEKFRTKVMKKNLVRFHEIMEDEQIPKEQKQIAQLVFTLVNKRLNDDITQDEVVERSGLSKSMVSKVESFYSNPSAITLIKYASAVDMELMFVDSKLLKEMRNKK